MSDTPTPQPVDPSSEPDQIHESATGLVVPDDSASSGSGSTGGGSGEGTGDGVAHPTGTRQAQENEENDPPA